jgi:hypothetical protein
MITKNRLPQKSKPARCSPFKVAFFTLIILITQIGLVLPFSAVQTASAQSWQWAKQNTGGCLINETSYGSNYFSPFIATDKFGNVYMYGYYLCGDISFGSFSISSTAAYPGGEGLFLAKLDSSGNVVWLKNLGTELDDGFNYPVGIVVDDSANIYICGNSYDAIFTCSSVNLYEPYLGGGVGMYLVKFDSAGNALWGQNAGGNGAACCNISLGKSGNVYLTGFNLGDAVFDSIHTTSAGSRNLVLVKYNPGGHALWVREFFGNKGFVVDGGIGIFQFFLLPVLSPVTAIDENENIIIIANTYSDTIYFNDSSEALNIDTTHEHVLFVKYDLNGNRLWIKTDHNKFDESVLAAAFDSSNMLYVTQSANDTITVGDTLWYDSSVLVPNYPTSLMKLKPDGSLIWNRSFTLPGSPLISDKHFNLYTIGKSIEGTPDSNNLIAKIDTSGATVWSMGCRDESGGAFPVWIAANLNAVYSCGIFTDDTVWIGTNTLLNPGSSDLYEIYQVYIAKYNLNPPEIIDKLLPPRISATIIPNPNNGSFKIRLTGLQTAAWVSITNILGTEICAFNFPAGAGEQQVHLADLPPGIYIAHIQTATDNIIQKIIIEK